MKYFKKGCALVLAASMLVGLTPGMGTSAAETQKAAESTAEENVNAFDAYRKPALSGAMKTWVYQGERFDYESSKNQVFADDQEDGDLTKSILQEGKIDTSKTGEQTITYSVTDSDGNTSTMTVTVDVLPKDADAAKKNLKRKLYTLPSAKHLSDIGFNRGYNHDRQNLGFWLPKGAPMKIRLVNSEEFKGELTLKLLNNSAWTEKLTVLNANGEPDGNGIKDSVNIPTDGSWVTVKNYHQKIIVNGDGEEEQVSGQFESTESVPFIYSPKNTSVQPEIEIEWSDAYQEIPYYRYGDDEEAFFSYWDETKTPYAIVEGQAATFLVPIKDRYNLIHYPNARKEYQFGTLDEMLEWFQDFVTQYDRYSGLDFYADEPCNQNVRAKFFIKANKHGAGLAYYSGDHSANNADNLGDYLCRNWVSLHEFGHGYEGSIAGQEHSFVESTNNIMGFYFEQTYRPDDEFGWLLDIRGATKLERYNNLGKDTETARNSVTDFSASGDDGQPIIGHRLRLFMWTNALDFLGSEKTTAAMHTQWRKHHYETGQNTSSVNVIVDSFSHASGYNVIPYFDGYHLHPSEMLANQIYDEDLPMMYYLRNLIVSDESAYENATAAEKNAIDAEVEAVRQKLVENGLTMNGVYSLVSTDDMNDLNLGYKSNVTLDLSIDTLTPILGRSILIKNGKKVVADIPVTAESFKEVTENGKKVFRHNVTVPVGIYEVELPTPREGGYLSGNEYLVAAKGEVRKEVGYAKVQGNPLLEDIKVRMLGLGNWEVASLMLDTGNHKISCKINPGQPHSSFGETYIGIRILSETGEELFQRSLGGNANAEAFEGSFDFPEGAKLELYHRESGQRMSFMSQTTKKDLVSYDLGSGKRSATYVMTDKGLMRESYSQNDTEVPDSAWNAAKQMNVYESVLNAYSDYVMENMSLSDVESDGKFQNMKQTIRIAYELLDDAAKARYDAVYGRLIGKEPTLYGYEKIDSKTLTGAADKSQSDGEGPGKALDGDLSTKWHSPYDGVDVIIPGTTGQEGKNNTYTITLPKNMYVGRLDYVPRSDGLNGTILSYKLYGSETEAGDDFTEISLGLNEWAEDKTTKTALFDAKNVRRIKIEILSTAGDAANKYISAAEFYLYEKYEKKMPSSYLSDMTLGEWDASVVKDTKKKNVTVPAGVSITADLIGKEFDEFAAKMAVKGIAANENATVKVYGDRKLIHQFDTSTGDVEKMLLLDIAGIRMLKVEVSGAAGAKVTLSDAKFRNQANKDQVFLVSGDQAVLSENVALVQEDIGKAAWSSSASDIVTVDEYGVITAVETGEATVRASYANEANNFSGKVTVEESLEKIEAAITRIKESKKTELNAYTDEGSYDAAGKVKRSEAIAAGEKAIDKAMNVSGIEAALRAAKASLDLVETVDRLALEELKRAKDEAKQKLDNYTDIDDYVQRVELKRAIAAGKANIDAQTDIAGVNAALQAAKEQIGEIGLEKKTFAVKFMSDGVEVESLRQAVTIHEKAKEPTKEMLYDLPEKAGYQFDGWYKDSAFQTKYNFNLAVTGLVILYAKWNQIPPVELEGNQPVIRPSNVTATSARKAVKLNAYFGDDVASDAVITWTSSDAAIAKVDRAGNVYFVATGEVTITASAQSNTGTIKSATATVSLPDRCVGYEDLSGKAWANTQEAIGGTYPDDGPAAYAVDGKENTRWHSRYSGGKFEVSKDNPAVLTIEFPKDLSEYDKIEVVHHGGDNGHVSKYQLVTGDQFDANDHVILNNEASGIQKVESGEITQNVGGSGTETLQLPSAANSGGKYGHYLQIRVLEGNNQYAAIREVKAHLDKAIKDDAAEQGYMTANRQIAQKISDLDTLAETAKTKAESDYSKTAWNALQRAIAMANGTVLEGATLDSLSSATERLNQAMAMTLAAEETEKKKELQKLYDESASYQEEDYTAGTWSAFENARTEAQAVLGQSGAALNAIDEALTKLQKAASSLIQMYTITFNWNYEGAKEEVKKVAEGFALTEPAQAPTRNLYVFTGEWYREASCQTKFDLDAEKASSSVTLYAKWVSEAEKEFSEAKESLMETVAQAQGLKRSDYTQEAWTAIQEAIADANAADSLDAVAAAREKLTLAMAATKAEAAKKTLRPIVTEAEALKKSDYTEIAWGELQDAIAVAKDAISEGALEDILAAQERLEAAVADTRAAAEKESLSKLCDSYEGYNGSIYTAESWEAFEAALNAAKAAVLNEDASLEEILAAKDALEKAAEGLTFDQGVETVNVTFDWNEESGEKVTKTVLKDAVISEAILNALKAPKREGYTFTGKWYTDQACKAEFKLKEEKATADMTLYAGWAKDGAEELEAAREELQAVYATYQAYQKELYTAESWTAFEAALKAAKDVLEDADATLEEVTAAKDALEAAEQKLVRDETVATVKVTFDWNYDGAKKETRDVVKDDKIVPLTNAPAREGYRFTGKWYTEKACQNEFDFTVQKATADITLYAGWEATASDELETAKAELNKEIEKAQALNESDYSPEDYQALQAAIAEAEAAVESGTLEALTAARQKLAAAMANTKAAKARADLKSLCDSCEGEDPNIYTEESWQAFADALDAARALLENAEATYEQLLQMKETLQAAKDGLTDNPDVETVTVTFDWNYEGAAKETRRLVKGGQVTPLTNAPEREGYTFTGKWHTEAECENEFDFTAGKATEGLTLYAEWEKKDAPDVGTATVTFDWNYEGAAKVTQTVEKGKKASAPANIPIRIGYTFTGKWHKDAECTAEFVFADESVWEDMTLYAGWKKDSDPAVTPDGPSPEKEKAEENADKALAEAASKVNLSTDKNKYTSDTWQAFESAYKKLHGLTPEERSQMSAAELQKLVDALQDALSKLTEVKAPAPETKLSKVSFYYSKYEIAKGKTLNLMKEIASMAPADAKNKTLTFRSEKPGVATVDAAKGIVRTNKKAAKKTAAISVLNADGTVIGKVSVKVMDGSVSKVKAKGKKSLTAKAGKSVTLKANVTTRGKKPVNKKLKWTSSNTKIATVSTKLGLTMKVKIAKGVKKGKTVKITATSTDGTNKKLVFKIRIK